MKILVALIPLIVLTGCSDSIMDVSTASEALVIADFDKASVPQYCVDAPITTSFQGSGSYVNGNRTVYYTQDTDNFTGGDSFSRVCHYFDGGDLEVIFYSGAKSKSGFGLYTMSSIQRENTQSGSTQIGSDNANYQGSADTWKYETSGFSYSTYEDILGFTYNTSTLTVAQPLA